MSRDTGVLQDVVSRDTGVFQGGVVSRDTGALQVVSYVKGHKRED